MRYRSGEPEPGEDDVPDLEETCVSKLGDLWRLGDHRLACGDATDPDTVGGLLSGARPLLMVTDPPYGVNYDPAWRNKALKSHTSRVGTVLNDDRADWREAWNLFQGDVAYIWHGALHSIKVGESLIAAGFELRAQIIWAKQRLVLGRGNFHWQHEPGWYAVRSGASSHWSGDRKQTTLWRIESGGQDAETIHGTQKPVECMRRPILNNSKRGQAVYDPFCGSGTTLIAAEATARCCYAIELAPRYVDLTVRRWEKFSGKKVVHEATGLSLPELATARSAETA